MLSAPDPAPSPPKPRQRWLPRPRFSLRTLVIAVLLIASAGGLWWRWEPWAVDHVLRGNWNSTYSPNGARLSTVHGSDIVIWDIKTGQDVCKLVGAQHSVIFSPDGNRIITGGDDEFEVWDASTGQSQLKLTTGKYALFPRAFFSPDGRRIFAKCEDNIAAWDAETGMRCYFTDQGSGVLLDFGMTNDGRFLVARGAEWFELRVYDAQNGKLLRTIPMPSDGDDGATLYLELSPTGREILTKVRSKIDIWDLEGSHLAELPVDVESGSFSQDGSLIFTQAASTVSLWDWRSGLARLSIDAGKFDDASLAPDGERIVTSGRTLKVWNAKNGKLLSVLPPAGGHLASFLSDGSHIINFDYSWRGDKTVIWHRRRPEYWWGLAWLPEFWLTALFAGALLWSVRRDRRAVRS